ncbi:MAG TPA: L,D-transpeptidase family protein [Alphaproteobacteria bacterium]|nr:L,D-transpeptidase family protein [Alphaproteobacteria bacterium]
MDLIVSAMGEARWGALRLRCALGRGGLKADKREGDGATPIGAWPMRRLLYRADRGIPPSTRLTATQIGPEDGWCDDPCDPAYNQPVRLPYPGRAERLWRQDGLYDLLVVLGHNDDPVVPGLGSAIFLHVAAPGYGPTEGCIGLARPDLERILAEAGLGDRVVVRG